VNFADPSSVDKVLASGPHDIDSKRVTTAMLLLFTSDLLLMDLWHCTYEVGVGPTTMLTIEDAIDQ